MFLLGLSVGITVGLFLLPALLVVEAYVLRNKR